MTECWRIGLAVLLTAVAGWVDAVGYLELGRLFVSFMSGNSTLLAVGLAGADRTAVAGAGLSVALHVAGAFLGTLLGDAAGGRWRVPAVLGRLVRTGQNARQHVRCCHAGSRARPGR